MNNKIMNNNKKFCFNCGNYGHITKYCHFPIISNGIIGFIKKDNDIKFLLIKRKDTIGLTSIIRGDYDNNLSSFLNLINIMTIEEKNYMLNNNFDKLWNQIWGDNYDNKKYIENFIKSKEKFLKIKNIGIEDNNKLYNLQNIINKSNTKYNEPEWGFPKGKRELNESNLECAIREFHEETNLRNNIHYKLLDLNPIIEDYVSINNKKYRHIYYIAELTNTNLEISNEFQKKEISDIKLLSLSEIENVIRPYYKEKINVLKILIQTLKYFNI
jgi:8-oxo-dGTP pyrophosphatase MutT (NUDIX family)